MNVWKICHRVLYSVVLPPLATVIPTQVEAKKGENAEFNCSAIGVGVDDFKYQWFLNKAVVAGQNALSLVIDEVSENNTGDYTCSVKNSYGGIGRSEVARLILGS